MNEATGSSANRGLAFSAAVEAATAVALIADPALVARLLLGSDLTDTGRAVGRCFGIALVGLALACWPGRQGSTAALRGMFAYNVLICLDLVYLGTAAHMHGALLWPAALLHGTVAVWLIAAARRGP